MAAYEDKGNTDYITGSESVVPGAVAAALPGNCIEMQIPRPHTFDSEILGLRPGTGALHAFHVIVMHTDVWDPLG